MIGQPPLQTCSVFGVGRVFNDFFRVVARKSAGFQQASEIVLRGERRLDFVVDPRDEIGVLFVQISVCDQVVDDFLFVNSFAAQPPYRR